MLGRFFEIGLKELFQGDIKSLGNRNQKLPPWRRGGAFSNSHSGLAHPDIIGELLLELADFFRVERSKFESRGVSSESRTYSLRSVR